MESSKYFQTSPKVSAFVSLFQSISGALAYYLSATCMCNFHNCSLSVTLIHEKFGL
ncbi:hypothetical protein Sjap_014815 [Stephania japonica]|uniref:Uncharacterized protein n=1 Tax=Stephania japonica TaxID=461633 RepID=A0AAP0NQT5_9MAGN